MSAALCITSFCICLNFGCAASGANPSITHSDVVKNAPIFRSRSSAYLRSVIDLDEQQSTTTCTSIPEMKNTYYSERLALNSINYYFWKTSLPYFDVRRILTLIYQFKSSVLYACMCFNAT